jgi:hypothetical protein
LKRLRELGLLARVARISTISGGSIVVAALVRENVSKDILEPATWKQFEGRAPSASGCPPDSAP